MIINQTSHIPIFTMDSVFSLQEEPRRHRLQAVVEALDCTYICLWSYNLHPHNFLYSMDGWYNEESNVPSSSSGSLAQGLFNEYRGSFYDLQNGFIPGATIKQGVPYLELKDLELLVMASNETQRQFYQEAGIKTSAFMGCRRGEIEIGMSTLNQINMEMEMRKWFPEEFSQQPQLIEVANYFPLDPNQPSSSSSSLISLSMESPECSSLYFNNISNTSYMPDSIKEASTDQQAMKPILTTIFPNHHALKPQNLSSIQLTAESDDAAITRAMLAVISSSPSSSSSSYNPSQNQTYNYPVTQESSAFKTYIPSLASKIQMKVKSQRENILNRSISLLRRLNVKRNIEEQCQGTRPTSTQLHHMLSERKRREKLNESFHALRSLLPPGTKRDKATVLSTTRDSLNALKSEICELRQKNILLEEKLSHSKEVREEIGASFDGKFDIQVTQKSESTFKEQEIELRVTVRGDCDLVDLVIAILEFIKQIKDVEMVAINADSQLQEMSSFNRVIVRMIIQGSEWDESTFREATRSVIADAVE